MPMGSGNVQASCCVASTFDSQLEIASLASYPVMADESSILEQSHEIFSTNSSQNATQAHQSWVSCTIRLQDSQLEESHTLMPRIVAPDPSRPVPDGDEFVAFGVIRLFEEESEPPNNTWTMREAGCHHATFPSSAFSIMVRKGWLRTEFVQQERKSSQGDLRVYVMPEDVKRAARRGSVPEFCRFLRSILPYVDISLSTWTGHHDFHAPIETYLDHVSDDESLFYIFNTLESPNPSLDRVTDIGSRHAIADILDNNVQGLVSDLYPYQSRSAAMMVQRETTQLRSPDPRKPKHHGPTGQAFYLDKEDGILLHDPHLYEEARGGILAETMGYGKTLICLAVILATRGHFPAVPEDRLEAKSEPRSAVASLLKMAAAEAGRKAVPWKALFHNLSKNGEHYERCIQELKRNVKQYNEPIFTSSTPNRKGKRLSEKPVTLCCATLVIVPPNLLVQWQYEISKHTEPGALDVLIIDQSTKIIPPSSELLRYDVILITKGRFEQEYRDDDLHEGRRRKGEEIFQSPLTDVRWLRVICDEGHGFAGSGSRTNAMAMLNKMYIERRWVVSGTPSNSMLGVEVGLAARESGSGTSSDIHAAKSTLQARRKPVAADQESKDLEKLRLIVVHFLKVQPWANSNGVDHANFKKYLFPYDVNGKPQKCRGLRPLLQSLIVRHRIEDIDADLCLPPLYNKVTYLEPSFYDKLAMNLFIAVLASNAVTSERTDEDYMFHKKNRKQLDTLINNLRQSSFHWVGFKSKDLLESLRISTQYLEKNGHQMSTHDRQLLLDSINAGGIAIEDSEWNAFSTLHEIGVYIANFPEEAADAWALSGRSSDPLLVGTVQARAAQQHVDDRIGEYDPFEGLVGAGLRAMQAAASRAFEEDEARSKTQEASKTLEEPKLKDQTATVRSKSDTAKRSTTKKHPLPTTGHPHLLPDSPLALTKVIGFSSAKLAYLTSRVLALHTTEKIIIFYDSNNVAFWIAEALELVHIKFLIYSNTLTVARRATYLATFNTSPAFRVLLMDLRQAALGLHIAAASRVFIVSPIWQPGVEAQAIKRAHRIGQTRPVHVETLVLRGTLEDQILRRRKEMSSVELQRAERSLLDDRTMNQIIRDVAFLPFRPEETTRQGRVARLEAPVQMFGRRPGGKERRDGDPEEGLVGSRDERPEAELARKRRKVAFQVPESLARTSGAKGLGPPRDLTGVEVSPPFERLETVIAGEDPGRDHRGPPQGAAKMNVSFLVG